MNKLTKKDNIRINMMMMTMKNLTWNIQPKQTYEQMKKLIYL